MTNKGVKVWFAGGKKEVHTRILPAFDDSISESDPRFATGFIPYRDRQLGTVSGMSGVTGPQFTNWYTYLYGYRMFGRSKEDFISPQTKTMFEGSDLLSADEMSCPVLDCYNVAKLDARWKHLTMSESQTEFAVLTRPKHFAVFNAVSKLEDSDWTNCLNVIPGMGMEALLVSLSWPTIYKVQPRDPNWDDYLLGDVTHPKTGLLGRFAQVEIGKMKAWSLVFSTKPQLPEGIKVMEVGETQLAARRVFDENTFRFEDYQSLVDFLVYDGALPLELIKSACGHRAKIQGSNSEKYLTASLPSPDIAGKPAQVAQRREILPPAAKSEETSYWLCVGKEVQTEPVSFGEVIAASKRHGSVKYSDSSLPSPAWNVLRSDSATKPVPPVAEEDDEIDLSPNVAAVKSSGTAPVTTSGDDPLSEDEVKVYFDLLEKFSEETPMSEQERNTLFEFRTRIKRSGQTVARP